jgi:mono/diheme cytochrome c family protein
MKCATCHGAKAEKKFDSTKSDDEHVQIILKGKKPEKPPNMPAYEAKGVTEDQARALLTYMKSLRQ